MINSVNTAAQTVSANANVIFSADRVRSKRCNTCCGGWLQHDLGSGLFTLTNNNSCGANVFEIIFNANVTSNSTGTLSFAIESNGEAIGGTTMNYTVATADVYQNIFAATLVRVPAGASTTVSIGNLSNSATLVNNANIIIKKIA